ncbi:SWF or SNF family helicase [Streptomyces sp. Z26]|uniref:SWIM zinc finger family protein n=1 Tax=Streptomyces sp. Z26 TaxID=2500177 RepID=UPI000EF1335E|nr:SWF or SNF family helicase [Streptomyces sp. Z26]RLL69899.1 SWF or SNF family helicase [Streptomyces sp. Z26]
MNGDEERVFEALPPARGRGFATTWWGRTWLKALEDTALDAGQLRRGRQIARQGAVGAVSVRPGRVTAVVRDRDGTPHRADVLLHRLPVADWDRLLDVVAGEAGYLAALLDGDIPPRLVEDAADAGVELLPGIGDLEPECDCGAWDHCPHTAALCYQLARLLDQDPFVLLLVRGRAGRSLLDEVQLRGAARAAGDGSAGGEGGAAGARDEGVPAREAYASAAVLLPPLPSPPVPPAVPGAPPALDTGGTPPEGVDVAALVFLASAAAAYAHRTLLAALAPGHGADAPAEPLDVARDVVRLAAARPAPPVAVRLVAHGGRTAVELEAAVRAWEFGGAAALAVLEEAWTPGAETLARARGQLAAVWPDEETRPVLRAERNRWTVAAAEEAGEAQLRYARDGRWWPYRRERGRWWPAGPAEPDPGAALAAVLGA